MVFILCWILGWVVMDVVISEDSCWSIVLREGKRVVVSGLNPRAVFLLLQGKGGWGGGFQKCGVEAGGIGPAGGW